MRPVSWCTLFLVWSLPLLLFSLCKSIVNGMTKKRKNHFGFRTFLCFQLCDSWLNCEVILDICCIKPSKLSVLSYIFLQIVMLKVCKTHFLILLAISFCTPAVFFMHLHGVCKGQNCPLAVTFVAQLLSCWNLFKQLVQFKNYLLHKKSYLI